MRSAIRRALLVSAAAAIAAPAVAEEIVVATALPTSHVVVAAGLQPFVESLAARTGGRVTVQLHVGGSMGGWVESFDAMKAGAVDGASVVDQSVAADLPLASTVSQLAMVGEDPRVMAAAVNELALVASPAVLADWTEDGVRPLAAISLAPFYLLCNTEVSSLDDLKGLRIRADGAYGNWVDAVGGVPLNIPSVEVFEAMQRKQVDCAIAAGAWLQSFSLFDVVTHVVDQRLGLFFGAWALAMNDAAYQGLGEEALAALKAELPGIVRRSVEGYMNEDASVKQQASGKGIAVVAPAADLVAQLTGYRAGEIDRVLAQAAGRNVAGAAETVALFLELVKKWEGIVAQTGDDYDAYEAALVREIFSKI